MADQKPTRKLRAILSADVKGYSLLMADDEIFTIQTIKAYRNIISSSVDHHTGRVVDSPGDNILAEFASAVDAVQCAVDIQSKLKKENERLVEDKRLEFRIGINIGDVVKDGERIYGDGVNVAARIEGLADPGGVCISRSAYDQIKKKVGFEYAYLGEQPVKNIAEPVRVYKVLMAPAAPEKPADEKTKPSKAKWIASAAAAIAVILFVVLWQLHDKKSMGPKKEAVQQPIHFSPEKRSIAVLPFDNLSGDQEQEYFSDGITEDIITDLSKVSGLFVIARNSSFSYKGKQVKVQDVAKDLGVRYVLEGSIRRSDNRLRITAQLIDAKTGDHLWAERYDREIKDIFAVQDQVTQKVVSELAVTLKASEAERLYRKHTENVEAYDLYIRIIRECIPPNRECYRKAIESSRRVIELDPNFSGGYQFLSYLHSAGVRFGLSSSPGEDVETSIDLAKQAVSVDNTFAPSYISLASAYLMKKQHEDALAAASAAVRIEPGGYNSNMWLGYYLHWMGRGEEAVKAVQKAQQLNPKYLNDKVPWILDFMGMACFTARQYEASIEAWKQVVDRFGPILLREAFFTASYSELGRDDEARSMAQQLLKRHPKFSVSSWNYARTYKNPEDTERLLNALRKAGLPD